MKTELSANQYWIVMESCYATMCFELLDHLFCHNWASLVILKPVKAFIWADYLNCVMPAWNWKFTAEIFGLWYSVNFIFVHYDSSVLVYCFYVSFLLSDIICTTNMHMPWVESIDSFTFAR